MVFSNVLDLSSNASAISKHHGMRDLVSPADALSLGAETLFVFWGHWSLVTLFTVSTFWSKKDRVTSDQVCLESHTCHTKMVRPLCGRLWPYSCPKYHFWRKSRRKASFLSFAASFLKEVSQKSFVLELRSFIFEGSFAEKLGFWVWKLQFWMKSRRKASF